MGKEVRGDGGRVIDFFTKNPNLKKKSFCFFGGGGGGGTKVSEYFLQRIYRITIYIFFSGGGGTRVSGFFLNYPNKKKKKFFFGGGGGGGGGVGG